jgi:predicted DCC family thiol-disulfide oxidoreductase YuxK
LEASEVKRTLSKHKTWKDNNEDERFKLLFLDTMKLLGFSLLTLCLSSQRIAVESFPVSASANAKVPFAQTAGSTVTVLRSTQANDDNDFDWKAIASHVFDETIDTSETAYLFKPQKEDDGEEGKPHLHSKPIILFDGVCNLCNGGVNYAIDHDRNGNFRFASLQSNVAKALLLRDGKDPATTSDVVLFTKDKSYYSSEAVAKIMSRLDLPVLKILGLVGQITPSFARNAVYKVVSGNRFILGENDSCRMDFDGEYTWRFVSDPPEAISSPNEEGDKTDE